MKKSPANGTTRLPIPGFADGLVILIVAVVLSSCATLDGVETKYTPWYGDKVVTGGGGTMEVVDGIEFWANGSPPRPHEVIGVITQEVGGRGFEELFLGSDYDRKQIAGLVTAKSGDGVVLINRQKTIAGYSTSLPMAAAGEAGTVETHASYSTTDKMVVFRYVRGN